MNDLDLKPEINTRNALINSGIKLFGNYGIDGTSTRMLAKDSGANVAMISYYFSNKEGLYEACLDYIAIQIQDYLKGSYANVSDILQKKLPTRAEAKYVIESLVDTMVTIFLEKEEPRSWSVLIMREQANPTPAFDIIYDSVVKRVQHDFTRMVAIYLNANPKSDEVKIRTHIFFSQILGFITDRECFLRHLETKDLSKKQLKLIRETILEHVNICLEGLKNKNNKKAKS